MPLHSRSANLEQLRKQAKELLREFRAGDSRARSRLAAHLPGVDAQTPAFVDGRTVLLAHALLVIARENGFPSWPKLKAAYLSAHNQRLAAAHPASTRDASGRAVPASRQVAKGARAQALLELSCEVIDLATRQDVIELTRRLVLTRRDILALRDLIVARGEHAQLVDALLTGLNHRNPRVRYDCAHALDHFADDRCSGPLRHLLDDPVPRVRRVALHVLSCDGCKLSPLPAGDDLVAHILAHAITDPSINVRRHATVALGSYPRDARAVKMLETLATTDTDRAIRREARGALRRRGVSP
jgi:hypothetical protein